MSELYNRINIICKSGGTNITALCKAAGVGRASLSELKAGRTKTLTLETASKLATSLGVSVDELLGSDAKKDPSNTVSDVEGVYDALDIQLMGFLRQMTHDQKELLLAQVKTLKEMQEAPISENP